MVLRFSLTIARHRKNRANFKAMVDSFNRGRTDLLSTIYTTEYCYLSSFRAPTWILIKFFLSCHSISNKIKFSIVTLKCQLYYEVMTYFNLDGIYSFRTWMFVLIQQIYFLGFFYTLSLLDLYQVEVMPFYSKLCFPY